MMNSFFLILIKMCLLSQMVSTLLLFANSTVTLVDNPPTEITTQSETVAPELTSEQREHRKRILSISWLLLFGVAALGGILILFAVLLAARFRRINRKASPKAPLRDTLWYLKQKAENDSLPPAEPPDTETE